MSYVEGQGQGNFQPVTASEPQIPDQGSSYDEDSLIESFLSNIPESDKVVVQKYVPNWNSQVTKKFQEIHGKYEPLKRYEQLGDYNDVVNNLQIAHTLMTNPQAVYDILDAELNKENGQGTSQPQFPNPQQTQTPGYFPPEIQSKLDQQEKMLTSLAQAVVGMHTKTQEEQEDAELDEYLDHLHNKRGKFDDNFILLQLHNGASEDEAFKSWNELQGYFGGGNQRPAVNPPPPLYGGSVPGNTQSLSQMSREDFKNLAVDFVRRRQQEGT